MARPTLEVGRVVRAHGLQGEVIVDLWTDRDERVRPGARLMSDRGEFVVVTSARHQSRFIVRFEGVVDRTSAESLRGVVLLAEGIDDDSVIWIDQLYGALVVEESGIERGRVVGVESNPASDLLVLNDGHLVPLAFVTDVRAGERVTIRPPEGLFD